MTEIEEIQKAVLLKWAFIGMTRKEIFELEAKREALLIAELRAKMAEKPEWSGAPVTT